MTTVLIWDGIEFLEVSEKEAADLVKSDMAQRLDQGMIGGLDLKYRHEFSGHTTEAEAPPVEEPPAPAPAPEPATEKSEDDPMSKAVQKAPLKNWQAYKKIVADELGKPFNRTTKADVEAWIEKQQGE